tara:strand:- start:4423 stop:5175 length:753 start_codon:yes stop_codon:yes gene_type:complete
MAERDIMSVAITFEADGAIRKAKVLDTNFKSLGASMQKGQARTEGLEAAQKKLNTALQGSIKSSTDENVQTIAKLQVMEAATSGLNQLISAQYKRIDADLAAGKITAEEAEERRKQIKQQEKYTGALESVIAVARLATVGQVVYNAVVAQGTVVTNANTAALNANRVAMLSNPWTAIAVILVSIIAAVGVMSGELRKLTDVTKPLVHIFELLGDRLNDVFNAINNLQRIASEFTLDGLNKRLNDSLLGGG